MPQHRSRPCSMSGKLPCECQGGHRHRPWLSLLGYTDRAGRPVGKEYKPATSRTRCQDGTIRLCERHAQRLKRYRSAIQGPNGEGVQPVAVQVAIVLDAIAVTDHGAERRPWAELVATTEIPWEVMTTLIPTAEKREIYSLKRRIDDLESEVAKLRRELSEARGEQ